MSGSLSGTKLFGKGDGATTDSAKAETPQVPVERLIASPRRQTGKGRRDAILTGGETPGEPLSGRSAIITGY